MSISLQVNPTFTLFRVDPAEVVAEYNKGLYANIVVPRIKNKISSLNTSIINPVYGRTQEDESFSFHNRAGIENVFMMTGNKEYAMVHESGQSLRDMECDWCRLIHEGDMTILPLRVTNEYHNGRIVPAFWGEDVFCDFRCALAFCMSTQSGTNFHDVTKQNSEHYLRVLYALCYPNAGKLEPAPHYKLLNRNRGPLTPEQFKNDNYVFVNSHCYLMHPVKNCYQRTFH